MEVSVQQYVGFNISSSEYMIPILTVREIITMPSITALPHLPSYVRGITNLRDTIIPVVNLKYLLNADDGEDAGNTVIVLATGQITFGIVVDGITGVINIDPAEIEPPEIFVNNNADSISGVAKLKNKLVVLLDTKKLLPVADMSLLEDAIVEVKETEDGEKVEVTRQVHTIGGKVTVKELHDAKDYLSDKLDENDPKHAIYDLVLEFMDALSNHEYQQVEEIVAKLVKATDSDIFKEVGKITRKLHDSLDDFKGAIDSGLQRLTESDVPNAVDKLQFVITKTEDAANKTMGIVERYFEEEDDFNTHLDNIKGHDEDVAYLKAFKGALDENMTEILTAQQFQDITGQTIKKVINLVNSVEGELLTLITQFGLSDKAGADIKPNTVTHSEYATEDAGSNPAEKVSQSDVESLLNDFGF
jgi:chemotaxis protein CheZ